MYRFIDETIDETIDEPISDKAAQSHVKTVTSAPPTPLPTHGAHPSPQPPLVLPLVETLCRRLAEKAIRYCHWKSNDMLARSASGDNDLDLLVSRQDAERFTTLLHELGFKAAREIHPWQIPGILDYYGYDSESGRLVHAHVHYQLIVGEDTTKNYHLPLEEPYLATATQGALFKTPAPEFEFILFVIRMILKHGTWDTMLGGWGTLATGERRELHYLEQQVAISSLIALLNTHLPTVDYLFFTQCVAALAPDCPVWKRIAVGYQLQRRLRAHARRGHLRDVGLRFWRRGQLAYRRRFAQLPKRQLCRGGALIAIIGGDGSGKTTAVAKTYQWLSADFDTTKVHLGKPPWSRTTNTIRALLKVLRRLTGTPYVEWAAVLYEDEKAVRGFAGYCLALRALCLARDLYHTYGAARRMATNGTLVVSDRFPLSYIRWMEGPQIDHLLTLYARPPRLLQWLARMERFYLQAILPPEIVQVLRLDPAIAAVRRADEPALPVLARNQEIWEKDWSGVAAQVIDATLPPEVVHAQLRARIWASL